jgi:hypothetical protein
LAWSGTGPGLICCTFAGFRETAIERQGPKKRALAASWLLLCFAAIPGCSRQGIHGTVLPNQPPTVELTQVPAPADTAGTYAYEVSWAGFDADGRIGFFEYVVDPPGQALAETAWVRTTANRKTFVFRSDSLASGGSLRARGYHTVVVRCVDDRGARSPIATASFTSTTLAPEVQIVLPAPHALLARPVPGVFRVEWRGNDPDGIGTKEPAAYRWKLFGPSSEFTPERVLADPDSVRRHYAPRFADWDSVGSTVRAANLEGLTPGATYVFVVVAFDQAGAYSPVFNANVNLLHFRVDLSLFLGPQITITSPGFQYTFPSGGYYTDPAYHLKADFAADVPIQLGWAAKPAPGGFIRGYRWGVDIVRLDDDTPRSDETTDLSRWSRPTTDQGVVLPPFSTGIGLSASHYFYLEAEDDLHQKSLAVLHFTVVKASFDRDLLILDDTWLTPDRRGTGNCVAPAQGTWPSAAELDTFLYATGDKVWRCYPTGTRSPVGLFAGYEFDTLATHFTTPGQLGLTLLDRYRNIIWMCDLNSAYTHNDPYNVSIRPRPLLFEWCSPSVPNPLATWMLQGGRLWLMGGGAAMATLRPWDNPLSPTHIFSSALGELGPGRVMYDNAHWQSEVRVLRSVQAARSERAVGGWDGAPDYGVLPPVLMEKSFATDPPWPLRSNNWLVGAYFAEHLIQPNHILERGPSDPPGTRSSMLDTLYVTAGGESGSGWPVMTIYHGTQSPLFVFSGFPVWYFQRQQGIELVDFVLQRVWGMTRRPVAR